MKTTKLASFVAALCLSPLAAAETIIALKDADVPYLISFDSATPQTLTGKLTLSGLPTLPMKARPVSVDFRPSGGLYLVVQGLPTATDCALYTVSTSSGLASPVGNSTFSCAAVTDADIDPRNEMMRIISGTQNYRLSLPSFGNVTKTTGNSVAFKAGDPNDDGITTPDIVALAHDQNVVSPANTTLYAVDAATDSLVIVGTAATTGNTSFDAGELTTFGSGLGLLLTSAALDISGSPAGTAYLYAWQQAATPNANGLYTVALTGSLSDIGKATFVGKVGDGTGKILSLTTVPGTIFLPPVPVTVPLDDGGAAPLSLLGLLAALGVWRRRRR